jgi:hypothetical protein
MRNFSTLHAQQLLTLSGFVSILQHTQFATLANRDLE